VVGRMEMEETVRLVPGEGIEDEFFVQIPTGVILFRGCFVFRFCISLDCMDVFFLAMALMF
jgi:hypothetical protein